MFQKLCKGYDLLDKVFCHLDIIERDYFGLKFLDSNNVTQWLDPFKEIKKQSIERGNFKTFELIDFVRRLLSC